MNKYLHLQAISVDSIRTDQINIVNEAITIKKGVEN